MYKMIIADDEEIIVKGLCKLLDWDSLGIEIIGLCSCYDEIVECLEKEHCDILITDVSMPGKNGIEAIKYIREKNLGTQVIFISGFSEFSYARDALRGGAVDYLTKPVSREGMLEAVGKAIKALPGNAAKPENSLIYYGVVENISASKEQPRKQEEKMKFYTALNIYMDMTGKSQQQSELIRFSLSSRMKSFLGSNSIVFGRGKAICVLMNREENRRREILRIAGEIGDMLYSETGQSTMVIAGETVSSMSDIPKSYESAENLQGLYFYCEKNQVIDCEHAPEIRNAGGIEELGAIEKTLKQELYERTPEELLEIVRSTMLKIRKISYGAPNITRTYLLSMLNALREDAEEVNDSAAFGAEIRDTFADVSSKISSAQSFSEACAEKEKCVMRLKEVLLEQTATGSEAILRSKEFIKEHYNENVTLESVANHVFMNPFYFSAFFKKHTNQNFKEYLNGLRLENARKLLITSNLRPTEIAEKTGFKNIRSMNRLFKEVYGKMPSEYRKEKNNGSE